MKTTRIVDANAKDLVIALKEEIDALEARALKAERWNWDQFFLTVFLSIALFGLIVIVTLSLTHR